MKRLSALLLALLLACGACPAAGHGKPGHQHDLECVLFGPRGVPQRYRDHPALQALHAAAYLAIDQYNGHGEGELALLHAQGIAPLPASIAEIDYTSNYTHGRSTHMGWEEAYLTAKDRARWVPLRRPLLLATAAHHFAFPGVQQQDAFCALIYYVHLLGDHVEETYDRFSRYGRTTKMPIARAHPGESNSDILYELEHLLPRLFPRQKDTPEYTALLAEIGAIAQVARGVAASEGDINTAEKYDEYHTCAQALLDALAAHVPALLMREGWFAAVFPE